MFEAASEVVRVPERAGEGDVREVGEASEAVLQVGANTGDKVHPDAA